MGLNIKCYIAFLFHRTDPILCAHAGFMNPCVLTRGLVTGAGLVLVLSIVGAQIPFSSAVGVFVELHSSYYMRRWLTKRWLLT